MKPGRIFVPVLLAAHTGCDPLFMFDPPDPSPPDLSPPADLVSIPPDLNTSRLITVSTGPIQCQDCREDNSVNEHKNWAWNRSNDNRAVLTTKAIDCDVSFLSIYSCTCSIPNLRLLPGVYYLSLQSSYLLHRFEYVDKGFSVRLTQTDVELRIDRQNFGITLQRYFMKYADNPNMHDKISLDLSGEPDATSMAIVNKKTDSPTVVFPFIITPGNDNTIAVQLKFTARCSGGNQNQQNEKVIKKLEPSYWGFADVKVYQQADVGSPKF